ncbi:MAG: aromatase/cyclase [Actinomycetota bacterium]|nr:aromatase/cyclase [Actinomycetota bacterium]
MPYVETSIEIGAGKKDVYELASDMEKFPDFMPDVNEVRLIKKEANRTVTAWETEVDGIPISWTEEEIFDDETPKITYKLLEGDLDKFEGEWRFEETPGGTKVTMTVDFDFGMPNLEELLGPVLEMKVKENSEMMLSGIKTKMEAG